ncbi:hypothetical protein [Penaeicola halotolerans]|uniref:hypothetical protein n=1 Tax=Penaeicola halotolerans TaxID=2793196 RepID=UPI001CF8FB56|nr:hypothetical protein [Penaeicola halotolerans]
MTLKYIKFFILGLAFMSFLACNRPPDDFPSVPEISWDKVEFKEVNGPDSLVVTINFKDAEGDLGLRGNEQNPPFQPFDFVRDNLGQFINYSNDPAFPPYNPLDWVIVENRNATEESARFDTLLVERNPNHFNISVKFFVKQNGAYNEFRWEDAPFYTTFNGRFPILNTSDRARPLEGKIRYGMLSSGWLPIFRTDTIRLEVQIKDRALNQSNVAVSEDFTLQGVRVD